MSGPEFWLDFAVALIAPVLVACLIFIILADDDELWHWHAGDDK